MSEFDAIEILLVEDSDTDAEMTLRALQKHGLAQHLRRVKDGAEALDFMFRQGAHAARADVQPKLVLLDVKLPKVDGIEVLRRLKEDQRSWFVPVVMLTSSSEQRDLLRSYECGVNSYLVKPIEFDLFVEQIAKAARYWAMLNRLPLR
jgi:two-component system, response regulator